MASGVHPITGVPTSITAFVGFTSRGPTNAAVRLFSFGDFERVFGGLAVDSPLSYAVLQFFQNGGTEAHVVRVAGSKGTAPAPADFLGSASEKTGLHALEGVGLFNIVCLPGVEDSTVLSEAMTYCERRRAFLLIDLPETVDTVVDAQGWLTANAALRSRNAAAYFPRLRAEDPLTGSTVRSFPNSGAIAGLYARTDARMGVWKAAAGMSATIVGAIDVALPLTDAQGGVLNALGLNVLRKYPATGTVCWGARTLRGADQLGDEYKYIPVRRLALFLEESLYRGTQWVIFEPNKEPLRAQIRSSVAAFLHTLFAQGAFQGRMPRDAYFVKCGDETTTQNDIDLGRVNIVVGFAPLKPAEFVVIEIQQILGAFQA